MKLRDVPVGQAESCTISFSPNMMAVAPKPGDIVKERDAHGEIDREQYLQMLKDLDEQH